MRVARFKGADAGDEDDFQTLRVARGNEYLLKFYRQLPTHAAQEGRKTTDIRRAFRLPGSLPWMDGGTRPHKFGRA